MRLPLALSVIAVAAVGAQSPQTPPPPSQQPQQRQEISTVITGTGREAPRVGLPDFVLGGSDAELKTAATAVADVLWKDLEFEEVFYMIERSRSASIPVTDVVASMPFTQWSELGAEFVIVGTGTRAGAALTVDLRVVGVKDDPARPPRFTKRYNCVIASPRVCAHFIADELHKQLAGLNGVAQSRIAFISDRDGERQPGAFDRQGKEVYLADYDGWDQRRVTATRTLNLSPTLSPDGQTLAYVSYRSRFPDNELYVVDRDGRNPPVRITNNPGNDLAPSWSPTGAQIAFVSDRSSGTIPMLYIMSADGTSGADRISDQRADRPSWSPQGNLIAFTCGSSGGYDVCVVDVQTRQVRKVTDGIGTNEQPAFAPNGQHILFVTTRWGKKQLATVNIKGTSIRKVTDSGNNEFPSWALARR